jgi:hypothetical protein
MKEQPPSIDEKDKDDWLGLATEAYKVSTSYIDSNYRKQWDDDIRAFHSKHASDSKYNSDAYKFRSQIFRPKPRSIIRKNEAAAAIAFFSNQDVTSITAVNPDNPAQVASASVMKEILQYRLTKTIPWFQTLIGGFQDAQTIGVVCSYQYWEYRTRKHKRQQPSLDQNGSPVFKENGEISMDSVEEVEVLTDKPCIELIPIENVRFDPAASWLDPVKTSPYFIHLIPMYLNDVMDMMKEVDDKTQAPKWKRLSEDELLSSSKPDMDTTRQARNEDKENPQEKQATGFEIVWIHRNFIKKNGEDWVFYTVGTDHMLSDPKPIKEVYFHGERPYRIGNCIIETHKTLPSSVPKLISPLVRESNEIVNQRLDNVKLVLNKRWIVKRGQQVDTQSLNRNVPGGVTLANDVDKDVREVNWQDVTSSAYQEQNLVNNDIDELAGNFSTSSVQSNRKLNETVRGMGMLNQSANQMTEYLIRTITETWVEPVLRQLVKLEQYYETDEVVMNLAADKAQLFQKFGINKVTDELLNQELTINVNVGMGATDPNSKMQKFMGGVSTYAQVAAQPPPGLNIEEFGKEIFGLMGYGDGKRFLSKTPDPMVQKLQQENQQLKQALDTKQVENKVKVDVENIRSRTKLAVAAGDQALKHEAMLRENRQKQIETVVKHAESRMKKNESTTRH